MSNKLSAVYLVLGKRLSKYGLELHEDKSRLLPSGNRAAARAHAAGTRIPTYKFLGFTCYWGLSNSGKFWRLKVKSRSDRKRANLVGLSKFLQENRNTPSTPLLIEWVKSAVRGWVNYHAGSDNQRQVNSFIHESRRILFQWLNRRGGKKKWNWERFARLLERVKYPTIPPVKSLFFHTVQGESLTLSRERFPRAIWEIYSLLRIKKKTGIQIKEVWK